MKNKTLVLDLDETLVHSSDFKSNDLKLSWFQINWKNVSNQTMQIAYAWIRPGALSFISRVSKLFDIIFFTASMPGYAKEITKLLDKQGYNFPLFSREDWIFQNGKYIKDLSVLNRDMRNVIIVDNWPDSYWMNKNNGLPISSWYSDSNDFELDRILIALEFLHKVDDVRTYIPKFVIDGTISMYKLLLISKSMKYAKEENYQNGSISMKIKSKALTNYKDESTNEESNDSNKDDF